MKNIISILFILLVVFVSCDQENIGTIYEPGNAYVAFSTSVVPDNILSAENNYSVRVQIVRSDLTGSGTANVELEMNDDIQDVFALESNTVTFQDGEGTTYAVISPVVDPGQIDPTKTYTFNLTLTGDNASELFAQTTYKASFDITFDPIGAGTFNSVFFGDTWQVDIEKFAIGNVTLYKAIGLYEAGYDIIIKVEGNTVTIGEQKAWYYDDELGDVFISGSGTIDGKVLTMQIEHYIPDVGGWDPETETLTLP